MTGVNRVRAKWVSQIELERRKAEGVCIRCGKKGHMISKCRFLPAQRPETGVSSAKVEEELSQADLCINYESQALKE